MKMIQEDLLATLKLSRPNWMAEEFIATRILRCINASGAKAYEHLKIALTQCMPECPTDSRWAVATFMLKRRIKLNLCVAEPHILGLSSLDIKNYRSPADLAKHIRESPFTEMTASTIGPDFYLLRPPSDECLVGYIIWNRDSLGDIKPRFLVEKGPVMSRIIVQDLDTFLDMVEFKDITNELML